MKKASHQSPVVISADLGSVARNRERFERMHGVTQKACHPSRLESLRSVLNDAAKLPKKK